MAWQDKIRNPDCELCTLHNSADWVCLMGTGPKTADVMIVGEAPGEREDEDHQAFVGPSGQLLRDLLKESGLAPEDCYITNVVKCRPPDNRSPERSEAKACSAAYLAREIAKVRPKWILALGNTALQALAGRSGITKHRGSTFPLGDATVFAAFHPAYALRNPRNLPPLKADVARFARLARGDNENAAGRTKVFIIRSVAQLKFLRRELMKADEISYDIETNRLEEWLPGSMIVSISFTTEPGQAWVVPLHHANTPWKDPDAVLRYLKPCLERPDCKYIAHNGKFDCRWLAQFGVFVPQTHDTMLSAHMLDENRLKSLKALSQIELGADAYDVGSDAKGDLFNFDLKKLCIYNGKDTDYTLRLYHRFRGQLAEEPRIARVFSKLMMPASNALTKVERRGVWLDPERLDKRNRIAHRNIRRIRAYLAEHGAEGVNFNSPQQVARWLFDDLGLPVIEHTKSGGRSTREGVILQLAPDAPPVMGLLKYRKWAKFESTYLRPWLEERDANSRFHPGYKLFGTVTGRLSGDFQQVPRDPFIRSIVGAPPGWVFVEADYSQIELRIAAMLARERNMLRAYALGEDLHLKTACETTGLLPGDITPEQRKKAKAVNFGFLYGMGWKKFVTYAFENYGVEVSEPEAKEFRERFFAAYPGLRPWHERQRRVVHRYARVHSPIGRVRHLPDVRSGDDGVVAEAERQAINSPVQSFASDLMLLSLVRLDALLPEREARAVGSIHDAILFEVREDRLDTWLGVIRETMEDLTMVKRKFGADITVPIEVETKAGQHWGEGTAV